MRTVDRLVSFAAEEGEVTTAEAYELICGALKRAPRRRFIEAHYYDEVFGNFIIDFEDDGRPSSIVNDRFELAVCDAVGGEGTGKTVIPSLQEADEGTVVRALNL